MSSNLDLDSKALQRLHRLGGARLVRDMIDLFLQHAPGRIEAAQTAERVQDLDGLERAVHSLKSSAGNLGAVSLQELAEQLEQLAARREPEQIPALLVQLQDAFRRARERLEEEQRGRKA